MILDCGTLESATHRNVIHLNEVSLFIHIQDFVFFTNCIFSTNPNIKFIPILLTTFVWYYIKVYSL